MGKNKPEPIVQTTATENVDISNDIFDRYDQSVNTNTNNSNSQEETNMNEQTQVQNTQNENQTQETTKKNINWKGVLKVGGTFILGAGIGAAGMYLYEKHNNNDTPNAESAFI